MTEFIYAIFIVLAIKLFINGYKKPVCHDCGEKGHYCCSIGCDGIF